MKKIYLVTIYICFMVCALSACGGVDEQTQQCIDDVKKGLQNRWEITSANYESYEEYKDNILDGIESELTILEQYKDVQFKDEEFDKIITKYICALDSQKNGIDFMFSDTVKYNDLFIKSGLSVRSECIKQLKEKYGFSVDSDYEDNFKSLVDGSYIPLIATDEKVVLDTEYGKIGVCFNGFEILTNPADETELVLYCEVENVSYFDEYNGENLITDYFIGLYDGEGYNIESKGECYDYIDGYKEVAGVLELKRGEKGKFALIFDYPENIDTIYAIAYGQEESFGCYLTIKKDNVSLNNIKDDSVDSSVLQKIDYSLVREQMSNFSCEGMYSIHDGWVYSLNFPEDGGNGIFSKMRTDGTEYTILTEKGTPYYIYIDGEFIYSIIGSGKTTKVYRCRLGGNDLQQLTESDAWYLQVCEDYIYYNKYEVTTGTTLGFYRANKDGSEEELIMDKEIYYSYVVGDCLYYQDDDDGETIHKYNMSTQIDEKITSSFSYGFVMDGEYGYYICNDKSTLERDYSGNLVKVNLSTKEETTLYEGVSTRGIVVGETMVYFINTNDEHRIYSIGKDGKGVKLISQDTNCDNLAIFNNKLMYLDYDDNGEYVMAIYLCSQDGSNKIMINQNQP